MIPDPNKSELFEVIKGNIKTINLDSDIENQYLKIRSLINPYLNEIQLNYLSRGGPQEYMEPIWPAGEKRTLSKKYKQYTQKLLNLTRWREQVLYKVYPGSIDDDGFDFDYKVEIKITRNKIEMVADAN